jgi:hypothetical protein
MILQGFIVKKLVGAVFTMLLKHYDMDRIKDYVEKENELDVKVRELEEKVGLLEQDSHPVADYVCTEHGCKAKRMEQEFQRLSENLGKINREKGDPYNE